MQHLGENKPASVLNLIELNLTRHFYRFRMVCNIYDRFHHFIVHHSALFSPPHLPSTCWFHSAPKSGLRPVWSSWACPFSELSDTGHCHQSSGHGTANPPLWTDTHGHDLILSRADHSNAFLANRKTCRHGNFPFHTLKKKKIPPCTRRTL